MAIPKTLRMAGVPSASYNILPTITTTPKLPNQRLDLIARQVSSLWPLNLRLTGGIMIDCELEACDVLSVA